MPLSCFAPVIAPNTQLLVLGSLPGERSLAEGRYYAHPRNQFWRLMQAATGIDLPGLPYTGQLKALLEQGIGLWDTVAQAERTGSLDANIKLQQASSLAALGETLPHLRAIAFNGATAARIGRRELAGIDRWTLIDLPSSSPAYTLAFEAKAERWRALRDVIAPG